MTHDWTIAARLTIFGADKMGDEARHAIARWLMEQAQKLDTDGDQYSKRFVARYHVNRREPTHILSPANDAPYCGGKGNGFYIRDVTDADILDSPDCCGKCKRVYLKELGG